MARLDPRIADVADKFVLVRLPRITGLDLRLFDFDHDLNFYVFVLDAEERVLGRYGGREAKSAEARLSMIGLRNALLAALNRHEEKKEPAPRREGKPIFAEEFAAAKRLKKGECIHCHQINEFRREDLIKRGKWSKEVVWRYPLPENIGLTMSIDEGDLVKSVLTDSAAAKAGLKEGDRLRGINGVNVASLADMQFALDRAPAAGEIKVRWMRDKKIEESTLKLADGWKRTNITWRPSLLDILISSSLIGDDLSSKEKKTLGLGEKQLAFRQDKPLPADLKAIGLREDDVIIGIDGVTPEMTEEAFRGHLRRNYLVGDKAALLVLRDGKRVALPLTFR